MFDDDSAESQGVKNWLLFLQLKLNMLCGKNWTQSAKKAKF
jgi:hypothetical protein